MLKVKKSKNMFRNDRTQFTATVQPEPGDGTSSVKLTANSVTFSRLKPCVERALASIDFTTPEPECMDQSSGSAENTPGEVVKTLPMTPTATSSSYGTEDTNTSKMEECNASSNEIDLPSVEDIISVCEIRLRKYFKRRCMEHRMAAAQGYDIFEDPNCRRFGKDNIFIDYYKDLMNYPSRGEKKEKVTTGSWLFLSFMSGGWSYDIMKRFIMKEYGVKYLRNKHISERLAMEEEYKAVVKFRSSEELNQVVTSLQHKNIHNKFLFFSFDKVPITFYDSDSDN